MVEEALVRQLKAYVKEHYRLIDVGVLLPSRPAKFGVPFNEVSPGQIQALKRFVDEKQNPDTFTRVVEQFAAEKGLDYVEVYEKTGIDRRVYSKIKSEKKPLFKNEAVSFGLVLKLDREEMDTLLQSAGFALSASSVFDLVIMFCLEQQVYDLDDVDELLESKKQKKLRG